MIEAIHYKINKAEEKEKEEEKNNDTKNSSEESNNSRTLSIIDNYLDNVPSIEDETVKTAKKRHPTPADATIDYVSYLIDSENENEDEEKTPLLKGQDLIDDFINKDKGKIVLKETPQFTPQIENNENDGKDSEEGFFTETLARIYIKQGRYSKALEIIKRLSLNYPKKNAYFADQIRFLEKLIINNNKK